MPGWLAVSKCGAVVASVAASLIYPSAVGPSSAAADPAAPPQADPPASNPVAIGLRLADAETALAESQGQLEDAVTQVRLQAVNAFVEGGSARVDNSLFQGSGGYEGALRKEYVATLSGNAQNAYDRLVRARADLKAEQVRLQQELKWAQGAVAQEVSAPGAAVAASASSPTIPLTINTPQDFAVALLRALGDPVTSSNTEAIVAWYKREGGAWNSPAHFNPLNTSMRMPGSYGINGSDVQSYTSWSQGLVATVATLNSGQYRGILAALSSGSSVSAVEGAVAASPWGTHF
ncbi:MAG TPA: hypothetical protein VG476_01860 [Acidimicrobiales bacterium]|nr:hypothetical protein [Acidimicrobiales bacterium]